jgi:hypothetical protein
MNRLVVRKFTAAQRRFVSLKKAFVENDINEYRAKWYSNPAVGKMRPVYCEFEIESFPVVNSIVYIQFGLQVLTTPPT